MASMIQDLVAHYGSDMAVLITFLKGCIITLLGVFHLGNWNSYESTIKIINRLLICENQAMKIG